jgi:hypothetical protein
LPIYTLNMESKASHPPELLKYGGREYLVYEVADHAEHAPTLIGVRLERQAASQHAVRFGRAQTTSSTAIFIRSLGTADHVGGPPQGWQGFRCSSRA